MQAKLLVVDLTTKTSQEQELPQRYLEDFLGGRGLGIRLLHDFVDPRTDPLGPDNCLIFVTAPLHATRAFYSSKSILSTKSPQTATCLYTVSSGELCTNLAKCGYAALVIKGKAERPTYLVVQNNRVDFKDASKVWGLDTDDAEHLIRGSIPAQASLALIGPAGENLVKYACIVTEGRQRNAFGRGGAGAVMGSKKLKAVAVLGTNEVPIADPNALREAQRALNAKLVANPEWRARQRKNGTSDSPQWLSSVGVFPTRQWHTGQFKGIAAFAAEEVADKWIIDNFNCAPYCPSPCNHWMAVREGEYRGAFVNGPEYETIYSFGSNLENPRFDSIIAVDDLCDRLGLDTISAGATIGWAMECVERGLLSQKDVDGLDVRFGNHSVLLDLVKKIAYRDGIGNLLAEGSLRAAKEVGGDSLDWAMTSKGMEFGGYEPRGVWGQAIQYALSNRGGCHHDLGGPARRQLGTPQATKVEGQGEAVKATAYGRIIYDCSPMCTFPLAVLGLEAASGALSAVTGRNLDVPKLREIGERILNTERLYVVKAGFRRADDRLPGRLLKEPLPDGPDKGQVVPLEELKDEFYRAAGWDQETGIPKVETLERLGIELRA